MRFAIITCTYQRPRQFKLLEECYRRSTLKPDRWVVVINGNCEEYEFNQSQTVICRESLPKLNGAEVLWLEEGKGRVMHAMTLNMLEAFSHVEDMDAVLFWEDDDWYANTFNQRMLEELQHAPLVGNAPAKYYLTRSYLPQWLVLPNHEHCSLAQTGIQRELFDLVQQIASDGDPFIDAKLWSEWTGHKRIFYNDRLHVGMKDGTGIGQGHIATGVYDHDYATLRAWTGGGEEWRKYVS